VRDELLRESGEKQRAQSEPLKRFVEDANMLVKSGIYGPYISYNGKNYRLPRGTKPESLTYVECQRIVAKTKK
jgi:DNA topoisomerase-1